jgi:hypothetical protein
MRYADFREQVWILWRRHRHGDLVDLVYRQWIEGKVVDVLTRANDSEARELARHVAWDHRLEPFESVHFGDWLGAVREYGFAEVNQKAGTK